MLFFEFFCYFFGIFYYASGSNGTKRYYLLSLFLGLFQPILAWNEAIMVFLNFFAIFLEFSITRRVGTEIIFIFSLSLPFPTYFGLKWCHNGIFFIFLLFFWNFLLCVRMERNETIIFPFLLSHPPSTYGSLKWSHNGIFEFFCYFFGIFYYALGRNET